MKWEKYDGLAVDEYIKRMSTELERDAIGMGHIPARQESFDLSNAEMEEFVRKSVHYMMGLGAIPVMGAEKETGYEWIETDDFGTQPDEIASNMIKKWYEVREDKEELFGFEYGYWFALPDPKYPNYVKRLDNGKL